MRFANLWKSGKKYLLATTIVSLGSVLLFLDITGFNISSVLLSILIIIFGILSLTLQSRGDSQLEDIKDAFKKSVGIQEDKDKQIDKLDMSVKKANESLEFLKKEKSTSINLLKSLLNEGVIEEEDIYKHIDLSDFFFLFCFANPLPAVKIKKKTYTILPKRLYPPILENIGFVRMSRTATFFVSSSRRLDSKLRNVKALKKYILTKVKDNLAEEWQLYLDGLEKREKFKDFYRKYKKDEHKDYLKFTILLTRGKVSEKNIGYLHTPIFRKNFYDMVNQEVDLKSVDLSKVKKTGVRKFVLDSSYELLFYEVTLFDLNILKSIEDKVKEKLKITKLIQYAERKLSDITECFKEELPEEESLLYSKMLKSRASKLKKALEDLGVNLS